jgi:hypothetical protein
MGKKRAGFYTALVWLANHPDSTAFEVCRGIEFADAWRVYEWLVIAEREGLVTSFRRIDELAMRWRARDASEAQTHRP